MGPTGFDMPWGKLLEYMRPGAEEIIFSPGAGE